MNNTAAMPNPMAFSFSLLKGNSAADTMDASFQLESEKKGSNTALSSDCCGCRIPGSGTGQG